MVMGQRMGSAIVLLKAFAFLGISRGLDGAVGTGVVMNIREGLR